MKAPLGPAAIRGLIPHRYPFLLVDRIEEIEPGVRAVGIKNVTQNEPFFQGHFPDYPVMPGVLIVEALAQVGAVGVMARGRSRGQARALRRHRRRQVPAAGHTRGRADDGGRDLASQGQGRPRQG